MAQRPGCCNDGGDPGNMGFITRDHATASGDVIGTDWRWLLAMG